MIIVTELWKCTTCIPSDLNEIIGLDLVQHFLNLKVVNCGIELNLELIIDSSHQKKSSYAKLILRENI